MLSSTHINRVRYWSLAFVFAGCTALASAPNNLEGRSSLSLETQPGEEHRGPPPASVVVDQPLLETVESWRSITGELRSSMRSMLATQEPGLLVELTVDEGDEVKKGQVVGRLFDTRRKLDIVRLDAQVSVAEAVLLERQQQLHSDQRDLERLHELMAKSSASEGELDDAQTSVTISQARIKQAQADILRVKANLTLAQQRLDDMSIRAPFAGRVVSKQSEVGQWLKLGDALIQIVSLDHMEARLDVPEAYIDRLSQKNQQVLIHVTALDQRIEAHVTRIVPDADPLSRLFPVRVALSNAKRSLRPGMSVTAYIPTGSKEPLLTVNKDAVLRDDAGQFLYYDNNGKAAIARVKTLPASATRVVVISATPLLNKQVVIEGNERLYPGQPLKIINQASNKQDH